ncbi:glutathione S-transferase, partial [Rhizobiaceae sp. 2RAB30]
VELMLLMLGLPYRFVPVTGDVMRSVEFQRLNPLGQIPVLQDGDLVLADSNAILVYLAKRYAPESGWLPEDAIGAHHVQRWLSIAAGELRYGPANARLVALFGRAGDPVRCAEIAERLLDFMEDHLARRHYLAAEQPTIADLACYAYVAHAPEGRISLEAYPSVREWLKRIEALPGFKAMPSSTLPKAS